MDRQPMRWMQKLKDSTYTYTYIKKQLEETTMDTTFRRKPKHEATSNCFVRGVKYAFDAAAVCFERRRVRHNATYAPTGSHLRVRNVISIVPYTSTLKTNTHCRSFGRDDVLHVYIYISQNYVFKCC